MSKLNKSLYPKSIKSFKDDPLFYEELTILKAQETIAKLMKDSNVSKAKLAKSLKQSKAHVTELLSDGRNLTLRTFARVCFHLKAEIDFQTYLIGARHSEKLIVDTKSVSYQITEVDISSIQQSVRDHISTLMHKSMSHTYNQDTARNSYAYTHSFTNNSKVA